MGYLDSWHKSKDTLGPVRYMTEQHQIQLPNRESVLTTTANILMKFFGTGCFHATGLSIEVSLIERNNKSFQGIKSEGDCGVKEFLGSVPGSLFYREISLPWSRRSLSTENDFL